MRYDLIALDEVGYVPLAEIGAEFLFQVIAERAERASLIVTTNLPFSEWTQVFPNQDCARRCWTESPIAPTSLRRALTPIASDEPWRCARRKGPEAATPAFLPPLRPKRAVCGPRRSPLRQQRRSPVPSRELLTKGGPNEIEHGGQVGCQKQAPFGQGANARRPGCAATVRSQTPPGFHSR